MDSPIKKTLHDSGKLKPKVIEKRANWIAMLPNINPSRLVFLDESNINTGMTRLYGRSKGQERIVEYVPDVRFQRTSIVSTIRLDGTMVPHTFRGSMRGERFIEYITNELAPTLKEGDILVLDNLTSHHVEGVVGAIEAKGSSAFAPSLPKWDGVFAVKTFV